MQLIKIKATDIFYALSDLTRLRIVRLLAGTNKEACLCELVDSLLESQYKLSRHLKILRLAGLLIAEKEGRWVYHRMVSKYRHIENLYQFIKIIPDDTGVYATDLAHFKKRLLLRKNGRCFIGVQKKTKNKELK